MREFDYLIAKKLAGDFNNKYEEYRMPTLKCRIRLIDIIIKVLKLFTVNKEITISVDSLIEGHFELVLFSNPVDSIVFLYSGRWPEFVKMILDLERTVYGVGAKLFAIRFL